MLSIARPGVPRAFLKASRVTKVLFLCLTIVTLTSCLKEGTNRKSSGASTPFNSETTPVRWSTSALSGGLDIRLGDAIANDFVAADLDGSGHNPIDQMLKQWNQASSLTFFRVPAAITSNSDYTNLNSFKSDGVLGIYRSDSWFSNVSGQALAVTQYFGYRRNVGASNEYVELYHADIIINYRDYNFSTDANSNADYDLHSVVLHELGHFIGLNHVNSFSTSSVMQPYLSIFDSVRNISNYDKSSVQSLYGISGLSTSPGFQVTTGALTTESGPKKLPRSARETSDGEVRGVIELRADGKCHHYENGKPVHVH